MSFPRRLPSAGRKIDYAYRSRLVGGALAYTVGFGVVGEYLGWWKKFEPLKDRNNPADMVEMIQEDDLSTWRTLNLRLLIGLKKLDVVRENSYKRFEDALPTGVRVMMNDEAYDRKKQKEQVRKEIEESPSLSWLSVMSKPKQPAPGTVFMEDQGSPLITPPREVAKEDLITFTSSKKVPSKDEETTIPKDSVAISDIEVNVEVV